MKILLSKRMKEDAVKRNIDPKTVASFGEEWAHYDQTGLSSKERGDIFLSYFSIFPWESLKSNAQGFDMGCGSGRWAACVAPRVGTLNCIDPSIDALNTARKNLEGQSNVVFHLGDAGSNILPKSSQDFGYSLGVLHHIPDTQAAMTECVKLLKPGAPFLVYLYYRFDNKPVWFKWIWQSSDVFRRIISKLPSGAKKYITSIIAAIIYWPTARLSLILEKLNFNVSDIPLSSYRSMSFYTMRTDARDRFGTPLEHRFTRKEIEEMMKKSGLSEIIFSDDVPYWCAIGFKVQT